MYIHCLQKAEKGHMEPTSYAVYNALLYFSFAAIGRNRDHPAEQWEPRIQRNYRATHYRSLVPLMMVNSYS